MREAPTCVKRTNKNDMFIRLTAVQLAVTVVIGAVTGAVYKLNRELFDELKAEFSELMSGGFDLSTGISGIRIEQTVPHSEHLSESGDGLTEGEAAATEAPTVEKAPAGGVDLNESEAAQYLSFGLYESQDTPCLPVSGSITSGFGKRVHPIFGTDGFHSGTDIAAESGTPVLAALDGTVCEAGTAEAAGNYVKLSHGEDLYTLYCHMERINTEKGVKVRKGDVIGFVGETGLATGPHLHFEVQRNGEKLDPSFLLEKAVKKY